MFKVIHLDDSDYTSDESYKRTLRGLTLEEMSVDRTDGHFSALTDNEGRIAARARKRPPNSPLPRGA